VNFRKIHPELLQSKFNETVCIFQLITDYFQPAVQAMPQQVHVDAPPQEIVQEVESAEKEGDVEPPSPVIQDSLDNSLFEGGVEPVILRKILKPEIAPPTYAEVAATMVCTCIVLHLMKTFLYCIIIMIFIVYI